MDTYEVFISYSHDSPEHIERVLALSNRLREDGIDCVLDQYETSPAEGWPRWMDKKIRDARYVVAVCTEKYYKKVIGEEEPGIGHGVRWEGNLVYQHFYDAGSTTTKFVPVLFRDSDRAFVPTPLKGATIYSLQGSDGYKQLLARLAELPMTTKPPLGKRPSLPRKPVKTNPAMYVTGPIDVDLWNKAGWKAVFFMGGPDTVPGLGLAFKNEKAARDIFHGWHQRFGSRDLDEELRISIIEGDLPNREPGYSVNISGDIAASKTRLRKFGYEYDDDDIVFSISRVHRMNPDPGSKNLALFKEMYRYHKTYFLVPGIFVSEGDVRPIPELRILKSKLIFRDAREIATNDVDSVVLRSDDWQKMRERCE